MPPTSPLAVDPVAPNRITGCRPGFGGEQLPPSWADIARWRTHLDQPRLRRTRQPAAPDPAHCTTGTSPPACWSDTLATSIFASADGGATFTGSSSPFGGRQASGRHRPNIGHVRRNPTQHWSTAFSFLRLGLHLDNPRLTGPHPIGAPSRAPPASCYCCRRSPRPPRAVPYAWPARPTPQTPPSRPRLPPPLSIPAVPTASTRPTALGPGGLLLGQAPVDVDRSNVAMAGSITLQRWAGGAIPDVMFNRSTDGGSNVAGDTHPREPRPAQRRTRGKWFVHVGRPAAALTSRTTALRRASVPA